VVMSAEQNQLHPAPACIEPPGDIQHDPRAVPAE
jgi:hypothetical protein